ncbi:MAG: N-ethylammeline chlorohydrolase [Chloroflexi bacterium]|nr:MAG: N-ethylammeline chlorohydrolase [Chloroflexota bacterium]
MSTLLRGGTLLPLKDHPRPMWGDLLVSGTRIAAIGKIETTPADAEVVDISGCVVMPGIVQTHVHLVQTLFRGLAEDMPLLQWLRARVWPLEAALDEASLRASVRLGILDLLLTGTTTVLDMGTTKLGDIVAEELVRSGLRARFGQAMMDAGDGVPAGLLETTRSSLDAAAALTKRWHKASSGRIGYVYMPRFALSCTRELLEATTQLAKLSDLLVHTHSNESVEERNAVVMATGRTPVQYLLDTGIACDRAIIAHGVHLDDQEIEILRTTKTSVAHCPSSNLKLASGIAQVARLRSMRITVGLGADGAACNNQLDAFEEMRLATLLARVVSGMGTLTAADAMVLATREGAKMLKLDGEIGTLEQGKRADLLVLDVTKLDGPGGDPAARILFGGGSRSVRHVLVDGEFLVRDGVATKMDANEVRAKAGEQLQPLLQRAGLV